MSRHPTGIFRLYMIVVSALLHGPLNLHAAGGSASAPAFQRQSAGKPKPCNPRRGPCPDTAAPTATITQPLSGSTVAGLVTIAGTSSDDVAVARVEVQI